MPFEKGNRLAEGRRSPDRRFRAALLAEIDKRGGSAHMQELACALLDKAQAGEMWAIREVADRIDGKVPQAIVGDNEHPPIVAVVSDKQRARALSVLLSGLRAKAECPSNAEIN
jgi:hypothetical protein